MDPSMSWDGAEFVTGRDLLHLYLRLRHMAPDVEWCEDSLADNPPRLVRLRQLIALFNAFGIPWSPNGFRDGSFIDEADPLHGSLLERAASEMPRSMTKRFGPRRDQLQALFKALLGYRERVEKVLSPGVVITSSGLDYYGHSKVTQLNEAIGQHVHIIDDILVMLISPDRKAFSLGDLVRDFGYPEDDLDEIDGDWW